MVRKVVAVLMVIVLGPFVSAGDWLSIHTVGTGVVSSYGSWGLATVQESWYATLNGARIPESRFYSLVGEGMLAFETEEREAKLRIHLTGGLVASLLGVGGMLVLALSPLDDVPFEESPALMGSAIGLGALTLGGIGFVLGGLPYEGNALDVYQARLLADRFNSE